MSAFAGEVTGLGAEIDGLGLQLTTALAELATLRQRGLRAPVDPRPPGGPEEPVVFEGAGLHDVPRAAHPGDVDSIFEDVTCAIDTCGLAIPSGDEGIYAIQFAAARVFFCIDTIEDAKAGSGIVDEDVSASHFAVVSEVYIDASAEAAHDGPGEAEPLQLFSTRDTSAFHSQRVASTRLRQRTADDFRNFKARNLKRHPRSAAKFTGDSGNIVAECDGMYFIGDLRFDPVCEHRRVHHADCETGAPVISTLDDFAEKVAAYLARLQRQKRDASR